MEEHESDGEIAKEAARDRILGVAIGHYLKFAHNTEPCDICPTVREFEKHLKPGELKLMGDLYAWSGRNDG
jgi:hypothetical protein